MGNKNQNSLQFHWQTTTPVPFVPNLPITGTATGTMSATNTIYTNIIGVKIKDNLGLQFSWTGTPVGALTIWASEDGITFFDMTFDPSLTQPSGSADVIGVNINQFPWNYIFAKYVNASGTGVLTASMTTKDLN